MVPWQEILLRLSLASFFGAVIGLERERREWSAGLRTHMMVSLGSSLIIIVSAYGFADALQNKNVVLDPSRIAAQVVSGIGFLGAGTILFLGRGVIRGLTTAAGLWTVAAIGLATGAGLYFAAGSATVLALIILWALKPIENRLDERLRQKRAVVFIDSAANAMDILSQIFKGDTAEISSWKVDKSGDETTISIVFNSNDKTKVAETLKKFHDSTGVKQVIWSGNPA